MTMTMNIQPIGMIHTPEPSERAHLWTAAGMAWNLAAELTKLEESK
jgi:hypothetical protein